MIPSLIDADRKERDALPARGVSTVGLVGGSESIGNGGARTMTDGDSRTPPEKARAAAFCLSACCIAFVDVGVRSEGGKFEYEDEAVDGDSVTRFKCEKVVVRGGREGRELSRGAGARAGVDKLDRCVTASFVVVDTDADAEANETGARNVSMLEFPSPAAVKRLRCESVARSEGRPVDGLNLEVDVEEKGGEERWTGTEPTANEMGANPVLGRLCDSDRLLTAFASGLSAC